MLRHVHFDSKGGGSQLLRRHSRTEAMCHAGEMSWLSGPRWRYYWDYRKQDLKEEHILKRETASAIFYELSAAAPQLLTGLA